MRLSMQIGAMMLIPALAVQLGAISSHHPQSQSPATQALWWSRKQW
jgi:hypothetical protein